MSVLQEVTVTNYTGAARDYLKKLVALMGANYTATLGPSSTVLVAAQYVSYAIP